MKRLVSLLTAILMLASIFAIPVSAADTYLSAAVTNAKEVYVRGDTIEIIFSSSYAEDSDTFGVTFEYSDDVFTFEDDESSSSWLLTGGLGNINASKKQGAYAVMGNSADYSGDLLKLTFTVNDDAPFGESDISCEIVIKQGASEKVTETVTVHITVACLDHSYIEVVDAKYKKDDATCYSLATYYKSCEHCGVAHTSETFETGEYALHEFGEWEKHDADNHIRYCVNYDDCDASETLAHDWSPACDETCDTCGYTRTALHNYVETVDEEYLATGATCSAPATYYKSCEHCGKAHETETFEYGTTVDHDYSNSEWESLDDDSHIRYCANYDTCGNSETLAHDWSPACDETCDTCGYTRTALHNYVETVDEEYLATGATCSAPATYYKSCDVCGKAHETETFEYGTTVDHDYSNSEWESLDDDSHIRYCANYDTCGNSETLAHDWTNVCDEVCDTCGHTRVVTHTYGETVDDDYLASGATCSKPATYYKSCDVCGKAHETETFEYGTTVDHDYSNGEWESLDDDSHIRYCANYDTCGNSETLAHDWTNVCDEVCDTCGHTRVVTHTYIEDPTEEYKATNADCMAPATYYKSCEVCGKAHETETFEYGELGDHDYSNSEWESLDDNSHIRYCEHYGNGQCLGSETEDHNWTTICDEVCDDCGHTRTVTHSYSTDWSANSSQHWHACTVCGNKTDIGEHAYDGHNCLICGHRKQPANQIISGYIYVNETYHMILIGNGVITTEHVLDINGDCIMCKMHIKDEEVEADDEIIIEIEDPVEPSTEEEEAPAVEETPEEAPATGLALGLAALAASALAVVVSKRR